MGHSLAELPTDTLAHITCLLYPSEFTRLALLSGNVLLSRKLNLLGGTKELVYRSYRNRAPCQPERLHFPPTLTRLHISQDIRINSTGWITLLPPTMLEIDLDLPGASAAFFRPVCDSDPVKEVQLYSILGHMMVNMSELFPRLRIFLLNVGSAFFTTPAVRETTAFPGFPVRQDHGKQTGEGGNVYATPTMHYKFVRDLPTTLSQLSLGFLFRRALLAVKSSAQHLESPPFGTPLELLFPCFAHLETLTVDGFGHATDLSTLVHLQSFKICERLDEIKQYPPNLRCLSLGEPRDENDHELTLATSSEEEEEIDLESEPPLPTHLKELYISECYPALHLYTQTLPSSLTILHYLHYTCNWAQELHKLPPALTSLEIGLMGDQIDLRQLPKGLTHLKLKSSLLWTPEAFQSLHPTITSLSIAYSDRNMQDTDLVHVPTGITKLTLCTNNCLTRQCFALLPNGVRELHLPSHRTFDESDLAVASKRLNRLSVATVKILGHGFPSDMTVLNYGSLMTLLGAAMPPLSASEATTSRMLQETGYNRSSILFHGIEHVPSSLTELDLSVAGPRYLINSTNLALKTLKVSKIDVLLLERLGAFSPIERFEYLTHEYPTMAYLSMCFSAMPNLRHLLMDNAPWSKEFPVLLHLETLSVAYLRGDIDLTAFVTLKELTIRKQTSHYNMLLQTFLPIGLQRLTVISRYIGDVIQPSLDPFPPTLVHLESIAFHLTYETIEAFNLPPSLTTLIVSKISFPPAPTVTSWIPTDSKSLRDMKDALGFFRAHLLPNLQRLELGSGPNEGLIIRWNASTIKEIPRSMAHIEIAFSDMKQSFGLESARVFSNLPSNLTSLTLLTTVPHNATRHLPRCLASLAIWGSTMNESSYKLLPRSLTHLSLVRLLKFLPKYARALPDGLLDLHLDSPRLSGKGIAALPRGLRAFSFTHAGNLTLEDFLLLPPKLRSLELPWIPAKYSGLLRIEHFPPETRMIHFSTDQSLALLNDAE